MQTSLNKKGFTLLEIIIVIYIFSMGILGLSTLVIKNIQLQNLNKNGLISSQLAQEGLELFRNKRDSNWLSGADWKEDLLGDGSYGVDYLGFPFTDYNNIEEAVLKIDANGFYNHSTGTPTPFHRLISAQIIGDYVEVKCLVQWKDRGRTYNYEAVALLYDWK